MFADTEDENMLAGEPEISEKHIDMQLWPSTSIHCIVSAKIQVHLRTKILNCLPNGGEQTQLLHPPNTTMAG